MASLHFFKTSHDRCQEAEPNEPCPQTGTYAAEVANLLKNKNIGQFPCPIWQESFWGAAGPGSLILEMMGYSGKVKLEYVNKTARKQSF